MIAETISVGTELLLGQIVDTNAAYLARALSANGVSVYHRATVGDNAVRLATAIRTALQRSDIVVLIGGLGPTDDDISKQVAAEVTGIELAPDPQIQCALRERAQRHGYTTAESAVLRQSLVPVASGSIFANSVGTAPGILFTTGEKAVICLPGPPSEFVPMVEHSLIPFLANRIGATAATIRSRTIRVTGMGESVMEEKVRDLTKSTNPTLAPYAKLAECHLRITAQAGSIREADALIAPVEAQVRERLGDSVYGADDVTLEEAVVTLLRNRPATLACAESCTGGLIAQRITSIPGASDVFVEGIVAYSNAAKSRLLGIDPSLIEKHGAVSEHVAAAMATGCRQAASVDFAVSTTGISGPTGGTPQKPVGLVYIGLATSGDATVERHLFTGSRTDIAYKASQYALDALRRQSLKPSK